MPNLNIANNPLYIIKDKELVQVKADKFAIGHEAACKDKKFTNQPTHQQLIILEESLVKWMGEEEQLDDVLVLGLKCKVLILKVDTKIKVPLFLENLLSCSYSKLKIQHPTFSYNPNLSIASFS